MQRSESGSVILPIFSHSLVAHASNTGIPPSFDAPTKKMNTRSWRCFLHSLTHEFLRVASQCHRPWRLLYVHRDVTCPSTWFALERPYDSDATGRFFLIIYHQHDICRSTAQRRLYLSEISGSKVCCRVMRPAQFSNESRVLLTETPGSSERYAMKSLV